MGDYLTNLTARVSGVQPAVRPRLPSLFEPPTSLPTPRLASLVSHPHRDRKDLQTETEEVEVPAPPSLGPAAPPSHAQRIRRAEPAQPSTDTRVAAISPKDAPPALHPKPHVPAVADSTVSEVAPQATVAHPPNPAVPVVSPHLLRSADRSFPSSTVQSRSPSEHDEPRVAAETGTQSKSPLVHESRPMEARVDHEVRAEDRRPPTLTQSSRVAPVTEPPAPPANSLQPKPPVFFTQAAETSAPSVQVVIGRVTVQAVTPSAPPNPAPPRAPAPRLSLEDYLKQREARA
jgi:hypothetical protein